MLTCWTIKQRTILLLLLLFSQNTWANIAEELFDKYQASIFQIRVMELESGNKTSIGSGFLISQKGYIATNYHVISQYIQHPDRYRLEFIDNKGETELLSVADIDVIHDLAIVKAKPRKAKAFNIGKTRLAKGMKLFALGNPHDLGMSIVDGTYNGLLEHTLYDKIFFSGSLNPGMSGGPALHSSGVVSGINVSTAGNQLSFLVPVRYLRQLYDRVKSQAPDQSVDFFKRIETQLVQNQKDYIDKFLDNDWPSMDFGKAQLPGKIADLFKCWGDTPDDKDSLLTHSYSQCTSEDKIYLSHSFSSGGIAYSYDIYTAKDLSSLHFYNLYKKRFGHSMKVNSVRKEHANNYQCNTEFTILAGKDWKSALCARNYKKYPSLWDVTLDIALISESHQGLIIQLALAGVTKDSALQFIEKFTREIHWQK